MKKIFLTLNISVGDNFITNNSTLSELLRAVVEAKAH